MFNPFRAARERREAALASERAYQLSIVNAITKVLETTMESASAQNGRNADAMLEMARAQGKQTEAFSSWLASFTANTEAPTTSVVTEEEEYREEQKNLLAHGFPADLDVMPEEFKLALALHRDVAADSMR